MIKVKRLRDGKVFTSSMSTSECILEIHFSTSYTQVEVQEFVENKLKTRTIICSPEGSAPSLADMIAVDGEDRGQLL